MLASAYVAARLISDTFEDNVEQWLAETSRFFRLEISEAIKEAVRSADIIGHRLEVSGPVDLQNSELVKRDFEMLGSVGYDLMVIYDENRAVIFASRPFEPRAPLPVAGTQGLFRMGADGKSYLMTGAIRPVKIADRTVFLMLGAWVDDVYFHGLQSITSLDVRMLEVAAGAAAPVLNTAAGATSERLPEQVMRSVNAGEENVFDNESNGNTYSAVYSGLKGANGDLVGVLFIGLKSGSGFFEQIGRWQLFSSIFALGLVISTVLGIWLSSFMVRPLRALTAGIRSVTAGDYQQRVAEKGGAELAELAAGFNGMAAQLSQMKALEAELRSSDRLSTLGKAAMVIAHEVRNPLGIIKTSAEVVRNRASLGKTEAKLLGYVIDEVRRIEHLVRDFLDFAHPKAPVRAPVRLTSIAQRVGALANSEMQQRGINLTIADASHGAVIMGDADQLHQALLNLVLNAMDAMPEGGELTVSLAADSGEARISVTDTGAGVSAEAVSQLFTPFFTTKAKGIGLGLAKVQAVAQAHGGSAGYEGAGAAGAVFTLRFPLKSAKVST